MLLAPSGTPAGSKSAGVLSEFLSLKVSRFAPCSCWYTSRSFAQVSFIKCEQALVLPFHCCQVGLYLGTRFPIRTFLTFWVPKGSLFL